MAGIMMASLGAQTGATAAADSEDEAASEAKPRGTSFAVVPGPFYNPNLGVGLTLMAGAESEIRWLAWKRVGLEGGVGVGKVFADFGDFGGEPWLPGIWGSGTYKIMEKQDLRARATLAYGKSGVLFYFTVGQNF